MTTSVQEWNGFSTQVIENDFIRVRVVPEIGAKIVELFDKRNSHEWLWTDPTRPIRKPFYGAKYDDFDISGFDECFPSIGVSPYLNDSKIILPDHGEIWSIPWTSRIEDGSIISTVAGTQLQYTFKRQITLHSENVYFDYEIVNESNKAIDCLWSAHPLFALSKSGSIKITGTPEMYKEFGFGGRIGVDGADWYAGHLSQHTWPLVKNFRGEKIDLSEFKSQEGVTDKVVIRTPDDGRVALQLRELNRKIGFEIDPQVIPYIGICFNLSAWPLTGEKATWIAIEPTFGRTDRLDECLANGDNLKIESQKNKKWKMSLTLN